MQDVEGLKEAGLKTGHAKRLVKVLGRSTKVMQKLAGVAPEPTPADSEEEENEDDPGEIHIGDDTAGAAPAQAAPAALASALKSSRDTPKIVVPAESPSPPAAAAAAAAAGPTKPVAPLEIRTTPRTPSDGLPPPIVTPPEPSTSDPYGQTAAAPAALVSATPVEITVKLTRHPKHGYGLDVTDTLEVCSVR
jgi:hypothetical protein